MPRIPPVHVPSPRLPRGSRGSRNGEVERPQRERERDEVEEVEFVEWNEFKNDVFRWTQGEHVTLIGPTGGGKTTLATRIIPKRRYMVTFATKTRDESLYPILQRQGFKEVRAWDPQPPEIMPKVLLHPILKDTSSDARKHQAEVFREAIDGIYIDGNWGLFLDELRYISDTLKLQPNLETLYLQGRSLGVSIIGTSQRPSWIPLVALSQATHLFVWRISDHVDVDRISGASGTASKTVREVVPDLEEYEVLYVQTRKGELVRTMVDLTNKGR